MARAGRIWRETCWPFLPVFPPFNFIPLQNKKPSGLPVRYNFVAPIKGRESAEIKNDNYPLNSKER
jgi:hypothetical protein